MIDSVALSTAIAVGVSALLAFALAPVFRRLQLVDDPLAATRKIHKNPIVLLGGPAIVGGLALALIVAWQTTPELLPDLSGVKWAALGFATLILLAFGALDDRYNLPPVLQLVGPIVAALMVVQAGIVVTKVTDPSGGVISFDIFPLLSGGLTFVWLLAMMYGTKLLDGLDGLSTGLSAVGALMIFALTHTAKYYEPGVGFLAALFAGACFGFLIRNFHPARAFLGEGGSVFVGFFLGVLAILSGSKIATTLLVMGLPVFDVIRVMITRKLRGKPVFRGDQLHLHHLMVNSGMSHRGAVLLYYAVGTLFGVTALFLQSKGKIIMLAVLVVLGLLAASVLERQISKKL